MERFLSTGSCYWRYTCFFVFFLYSSMITGGWRSSKNGNVLEASHNTSLQGSLCEGRTLPTANPASYIQSHALQSSRNFNNCWFVEFPSWFGTTWGVFWVNRSTPPGNNLIRVLSPSCWFPNRESGFRPPSIHWCVRAWQWSRSPTPRHIACARRWCPGLGWFTLSPAMGIFSYEWRKNAYKSHPGTNVMARPWKAMSWVQMTFLLGIFWYFAYVHRIFRTKHC